MTGLAPAAPVPRLVASALVVLVLDQLAKQAALAHVFDPPRRIAVTGFFDLVPVWNRGVSFGLFAADSPWTPWLLSAIAVAVVVALIVWARRDRDPRQAIAIGLVVGGAIGNVVDRVRFGAVVDFIDLHAAGYHWPAFNVADAAISLGAVWIAGRALFAGGDEAK